MARLIAITGPAAVGKSTVARGLQAALSRDGELWLLMQLDDFGRSLSRHWIAVGDQRGRYAERGFTYAADASGAIGLALGPDARRVLAAFHRAVAAVVRSGVDVVCETIVHDNEDWTDWTAALDGLPVFWVRLTAPIDALEARERDRQGPLARGLARGMASGRLVGRVDLEADTLAEDARAIVARITASAAASVPGT